MKRFHSRVAITLFAFLLCSVPCFAQITLDVRVGRAITELVDPIPVGKNKVIHFGESEKVLPVALVTITSSSCKFNLVRAYASTGGRAPMQKIDDTHWELTGSGEFNIEAIGFDPTIEEASVTVTLGPKPGPGPGPGPQPGPDVPPDGFDNLGQRVAAWSAGIAGREKVGAAYFDAAQSLRNDPSQTINSVAATMSQRLLLLPEYVNFKAVTMKINADSAARTFSRGTYADWLTAVALGMGVK